MKTRNIPTLLVAIVAAFLVFSAAHVEGRMIGINVLLNQPVTNSILQDLGAHGQVLDVISQINAVTLRAQSSDLSAIQTLSYVAGANPDVQVDDLDDFSDGSNYWILEARLRPASLVTTVMEFTSA